MWEIAGWLLGHMNVARARYFISTDNHRCRERVGVYSATAHLHDAIAIRADVVNFGLGRNPPACEVLLMQIRFNDRLIEDSPCRLQWTELGNYSGISIVGHHLINVCGVEEDIKPTLRVYSEKGERGYHRFTDPGIYKFYLQTLCNGSSTGTATLVVSFDNNDWQNLYIVNCYSRPKYVRVS